MLTQIMKAYDLLDSAKVNGESVVAAINTGVDWAKWTRVPGPQKSTDSIRVSVPGSQGKISGGQAPTISIVGRLGGVGVRPVKTGIVSDADGAIVAIACAFKLREMLAQGDQFAGDVIISTHVCPNSNTQANDGVLFMGSPVSMATLNATEVDPAADAVISLDATKGNRVLNISGIAITPTVKEGYILRVAPDLLTVFENTTGRLPVVLPITMPDITPYDNGLYHINSILQPAVVTDAPVVGVAVTAQTRVPGAGTNANSPFDLELAGRFTMEVARAFTAGEIKFYDQSEFDLTVKLYGSMKHLQTFGKK